MGVPVRAMIGLLTATLWLLLAPVPLHAQQTEEPKPAEASAAAPDERPIDAMRRQVPEHWRRRARMLRERVAPRVERGLAEAYARTPERVRPFLRVWGERVNQPDGRRLWLGVAGLLLFGLAFWRVLRGPGDVVVSLEYPAELSGSYSVYLTRRRRKSVTSRKQRERNREKVSTATEHHGVARETKFRGVRPRSYWLTVEGRLRDLDTDSTLLEPYEQRPLVVQSGRTERVELDFRPRGCPIELSVLWDGRPAQEASVAVAGRPDQLRFARGGQAQLALPTGAHRIVVGSGDRVGELEIELEDFRAHQFDIDLGRPEQIVFKGCPGAVTPYLQGDLQAASRALERDGQTEIAHRLKARQFATSGRAERAAEYLEEAGLYRDAAELRESLGDRIGAASSFRLSGGESDRSRAIELLQQVAEDESGYRTACEMLAEIFEDRDELEAAAECVERAIAIESDAGRVRELRVRLAGLVEGTGDLARALELLQELHGEAPDHPNLETRIDEIKKKLSVGRTSPGFSEGDALAEPEAGSRYEILEQVGRGGMAVVFKARDRRLGRVVALKKLPENLRDHSQAVELFVREARAAAALNHRNIVTIFDADREDDNYFITMELLEGCTVSQLRKEHTRLGVRDTAMLCRQVCSGLAYAHHRRIVHRDIKPANLFLTRDRIVKIMDFGLAKMLEEVRRQTTVVGGTPFYVAPEQIMGEDVDGRADLYALGVTLFELLTGDVPFREGDVTHHHRHTPPPDPRERAEDLPDAMAELILQLMEKRPEDRPCDPDEVRNRLESFTS
jgi:tRNA A-37 threonylcarbamoyl transferase component Bud32